MKKLTIELTDEQWRELELNWDYWQDESFPIHTAYYFKEALIRAGYMKGNL